tara:strand:- start:238 stop:438 length:201 start_codon:yes stop_codon:yes gene_type:complete
MENFENTDRFPPIPHELLAELEKRFPERCPDLKTDERVIWFYSGQRAVVRFLWEKYNQSVEKGLGK